MKRLISFALAITMVLSGCAKSAAQLSTQSPSATTIIESPVSTTEAVPPPDVIPAQPISPAEPAPPAEPVFSEDVPPNFASLNDPALLQYTEDNVYAGLTDAFNSEDYIIENVSAVYISQEYIEEAAYNSKSNIYFGYTLEELDEQFQGTRYIFSLAENGETIVEEFVGYDDAYEQVIQNVAMGAGVILVRIMASVVSGSVRGSGIIQMILAFAAKTGIDYKLCFNAISTIVAAIITDIETGKSDEILNLAATLIIEGFKWGAIVFTSSGEKQYVDIGS